MKKGVKFIFLTVPLVFLVAGLSFGQYPEFSFGKKVIEETAVVTSYGILKSSFISSKGRYYILWELRGGDKNYSLLLRVSEDDWYVKIRAGRIKAKKLHLEKRVP